METLPRGELESEEVVLVKDAELELKCSYKVRGEYLGCSSEGSLLSIGGTRRRFMLSLLESMPAWFLEIR